MGKAAVCEKPPPPKYAYVGMVCIMLEMMMSVLQEIEGLTKHYTLQKEDQFSCKNSGSMFTRFTSRHSLHYNVLSGLIIISFSRVKYALAQVKTCQISCLVVLWLLSYASS